jgi:hypothetical protein
MPQNATSTKSPAVKAAVMVKFAEGRSRAQIARELRIDRETVTRILSEPEIEEAIEQARARCIALLPDAVRAVKSQLRKGDGDLGLRFLEKMGVLNGDAASRITMNDDPKLQVAIQLLMPPTMGTVPVPHGTSQLTGSISAGANRAHSDACESSTTVQPFAKT